jgi:Xaa-Pro aminopeptidase
MLHEMRLVKTADDIELLRRAIDITCEGHLAAIRALRPGVHEYEIEAAIRYVFRKNGSPRSGYPPIVASAANATVLHYTTNNRRIEDGDLVLIDAGAEFGYYTGDVTRTLPARGSFTEDQATLYQLVLDAQSEAVSAIRPGGTFIEPHERAVRVLTEGMVRLGLLKGDVDKLIEDGKRIEEDEKLKEQPDAPRGYREFYMHRTSHWLGMDVHDAGPYKVADEWRRLAPGMVMTVEPGIYISEDAEGVDPRYRGIGIRIEDDVLVTETGSEVLSARVPKAIEEIEGMMTGSHLGE